MGPRIRFLLVVLILSVATWAYILVSEYLVGSRGLNLSRYLHGSFIVGLSVLGGYMLVWMSVRFMNFKENRKTGFEAINMDDTGTTFNMKLSLCKFLPEIVAPPSGQNISPLEAELLGFLNSLGNWPYSLSNPEITLREYALNLWTVMDTLPHSGPLHRAAALAADLGKVYAYQEKRKSAPLSHFWKRDKVTYSRRCHDHGGMAAFVLSQMPAFRKLGGNDSHRNQLERRALLTAVRYYKDPLSLPQNCDALARDICEYLSRAQAQLAMINQGNTEINAPSQEDIEALQTSLETLIPSLLTELDFRPEYLTQKGHGFFQAPHFLIVSGNALSTLLVQNLPPSLRTTFQLWETHNATATLLPYLLQTSRAQGWLVETWEQETSEKGTFSFNIGGTELPHCLILQLTDLAFASQLKTLKKQDPLLHPVELHYDLDHQKRSILHKAQLIDDQLSEIFMKPAQV